MDKLSKITDYAMNRETRAVSYHKLTYGDVFWLTGLIGSILGIILNALLILVIRKNGFRLFYARLFLSAASFDLFFSIVEVLTQHQIAVKNGVLFFFPRGVEWWFDDFISFNHLIFVVHCFVYIQSILILGALFRYRYVLGQEEYLSHFYLIDGLIVSSFGSFILAVAATVGVYQAGKRRFDYYLSMIKRNYDTTYFMYAMDIRDSGTIIYLSGGIMVSIVALGISIYYAVKSFSQLRIEEPKYRILQTQLTLGLVTRTFITIIFWMFSLFMTEICLICRFDTEIFGTSMMALWPWTPVANAIAVFCIAKPYKRYILGMMDANINRPDIQLFRSEY